MRKAAAGAGIIAGAAMFILAGAFAAHAQSAGDRSQGGSIVSTADVVRDIAPTGKLRAAINLGNMVLAQKDPATGETVEQCEHPCLINDPQFSERARQAEGVLSDAKP